MIEYRAILRKRLRFDGGFKLENGTIIYARETEHGWIGSYYEDKGACHSFSLADDAFSILEAGDVRVAELVITPDPPEPPERIRETRDMEHKRLLSRIRRHREEADALEALASNQESRLLIDEALPDPGRERKGILETPARSDEVARPDAPFTESGPKRDALE